jgi:hypothetical protein
MGKCKIRYGKQTVISMGKNFRTYKSEEYTIIFPEESGLENKIFIRSRSNRKYYLPKLELEIEGINYSIKIIKSGDLIWNEPLPIREERKKAIEIFIMKNKESIIDHANGIISSDQFANKLVSIKNILKF